jgi:hypothetical protein
MKLNGFHASTAGGQKVLTVSLVLALVLASVSIVGALAAPTLRGPLERGFGDQLRELNAARDWYNRVRSQPSNFISTSDPAKAQQYLGEYASALAQADAIVSSGGTATTSNRSAKQNLSSWLHVMRGLRDKLI